mmetsp:Transcript_23509/g.39907  ORF Transcript_23509/g.39907 Transcript_23509/m.39907 type:complete len:99 (-) Transcript_23509:2047-2343(-)
MTSFRQDNQKLINIEQTPLHLQLAIITHQSVTQGGESDIIQALVYLYNNNNFLNRIKSIFFGTQLRAQLFLKIPLCDVPTKGRRSIGANQTTHICHVP